MMLRRSLLGSLLAAAIAATVAGCAPVPGDAYDLYIDPTFSAADFLDITAAADVWQAAVPVTFFQARAACPGQYAHVICIVNDPAEVEANEARLGGGLELGAYTHYNDADEDGATIYVDSPTIRADVPTLFETTIAHQLGHAMGQIAHRDGLAGGSVMATILQTDALKPTCNDANDWLANRGRKTETCK